MADEFVRRTGGSEWIPYWAAARSRELRFQRCRECGRWRHPPGPMCPQCNSLAYEWARASGRGTVHTFTLVHGPTLPVFQERAPYNVVVIHLDEGPFMVSNLVDCPVERMAIGLPVEVVFEDLTETISLPKFRPVVSTL